MSESKEMNTCPHCLCQIKDPFFDIHSVHDVERCRNDKLASDAEWEAVTGEHNLVPHYEAEREKMRAALLLIANLKEHANTEAEAIALAISTAQGALGVIFNSPPHEHSD
jgi:hypothetical protein